jgi:peptidylamidoglycolate lyase
LFFGALLPACESRVSGGVAGYSLVAGWPGLPDSLTLGNPAGIGIDTSGHLLVFCRRERNWPVLSPMPAGVITGNTVLELDAGTGALLAGWGAGRFIMPHGLTVDASNNIWVTDVGLHQVMKFTHEGKLLMTLGVAGVPGDDSSHFNRPTDIAVAPDGSIYVSDGYRNSRVVKFAPDGQFLLQWGRKGSGESEFDVPHGICLDDNGNVFVADRKNCRVEVFDPQGRFLRQLIDKRFGNICAVAFNRETRQLVAVDDKSWLKLKHRGSDILVIDPSGTLQYRFGRSGSYAGPTCWYHDIAIGKDGSLFVADILGNRLQKFTPRPAPAAAKYSR